MMKYSIKGPDTSIHKHYHILGDTMKYDYDMIWRWGWIYKIENSGWQVSYNITVDAQMN